MTTPARALWQTIEPYHALTYFAPESQAEYERVGLRGLWPGYFAGRAAPLGPVDAGVHHRHDAADVSRSRRWD